jgi:hypothetical protein
MKLLIASSFLFANAYVSAFSLAPAANTHGTTSTVSSDELREKMKKRGPKRRRNKSQLSSTIVFIIFVILLPFLYIFFSLQIEFNLI